ncbi:xyloside xylosyltransferase 1 [Denticeps clupeoides]|uniref:Xyloside xylosyltransferase 1 n=1 Tax=Denticeps clupeoides TaxID=299321 RepID=A0AAY4DTK4_9TELE|nr:xyloside xylosyltransferase 1 [Denticeps clupeoides]
MGILRLFSNTMLRIGTFRSYQIVLLACAALAVVAFYYFGSERQNFSSTTKRIKETQASHNANRNDADLSVDTGPPPEADQVRMRRTHKQAELARHYHALMMFTKLDRSKGLQAKFQVAMRSLVEHGRFLEEETLLLHFVSDDASRQLGEKMLPGLLLDASFKYDVLFHDVAALTEKLYPIVEAMQKHFSAGSGAYYSDSIFFLSVAMHRIMPSELTRIVQLDLDLKYQANIRDLFQEFDGFPPDAVIGIVREMQPVYRHTFWQYRKENPRSGVGDPPPEGQPGFNSGVMLLDLEAMRVSALYNQLLEPERVARLADKYHFRGHLGDQDFFTMIGMEHPELFQPLACGWNRQLCTWWREHGYADIFQLYYHCDGPVYIYHGNCNTPIPDD